MKSQFLDNALLVVPPESPEPGLDHGEVLEPVASTLARLEGWIEAEGFKGSAGSLLPIGGEPMLSIWLDLCHRHGIDEVLINAHAHGEQVQNFVAAHRNGVRTTVVGEPRLLGSAGTILANREWVAGERCFWILYADVLTNADLGRMMEFHEEHGQLATLGGYEVSDPERCGIMEVDEEGNVQQFVEKPKQPVGRLAFSGLMIADAALLDQIPASRPADLGFDTLPRLGGKMAAFPISDYLLDIGTLENYERAQKTWPGLD